MRSFFSAFDSFFFKFFDMLGRSSRSDYWCVMPVLWAAMLGLVWWDGTGIWQSLESGEMPNLNPFAYGSVLFILVTAIPRLTLAMRRLQDSGRKGKWATLPYSAGLLALLGLIGLATSGAFVIEGDFASAGAPMVVAFSFGSVEAFVLGIYEVLSNIENVRFVGEIPSGSELAGAIGDSGPTGRAIALPMILMMCMMFVYPPIAVLIYVFFVTMPSEEDENAYGLPTDIGLAPHPTAKGEHNAFASYAILTKQGEKPSEDEIAARKETVHSLYEQRVLGRQ